jgi:hypothetical protein
MVKKFKIETEVEIDIQKISTAKTIAGYGVNGDGSTIILVDSNNVYQKLFGNEAYGADSAGTYVNDTWNFVYVLKGWQIDVHDGATGAVSLINKTLPIKAFDLSLAYPGFTYSSNWSSTTGFVNETPTSKPISIKHNTNSFVRVKWVGF